MTVRRVPTSPDCSKSAVPRPATQDADAGRPNKLRGATLFSGIGAPECAAPFIDWRWCAEIDPFPSAVHAARFPGIPNHSDVTRIDPDAVEPVDIVVFGSPCQSFSVAGKRLGLDDPRGNLALVALRLVARLRPSWILFENVPGLFSSFSGSEQAERDVQEGPVGGRGGGQEDRDFAAFLSGLRECGYLGCWRVLDAQYAGVPQRRRRVFFVGYLGDWRPPAAVLFERESLQGHPAPRREAGEGVAHFASTGAGEYGPGVGSLRAKGADAGGGSETLLAFGGNNTAGPLDVATAVNAHGGPHGRLDFESETFVAHSLRADGFDASEDGPPLAPVWSVTQDSCPVIGENVTSALKVGTGLEMGQPPCIAFTCKDHGADAGDVSPTLRAMPHHGSHANAGGQVAVAVADTLSVGANQTNGFIGEIASRGSAVRRLLPVECEKLQGFPPGWTAITHRGKPAADGNRYKSLGNSMAVPVLRDLLTRIADVDAIIRTPNPETHASLPRVAPAARCCRHASHGAAGRLFPGGTE
jgi:DNA (cytosine-5)-methyltransferase 1